MTNIDFVAFSDELQKIAQHPGMPPDKGMKRGGWIGGLAGAGTGAAAADKLVGAKDPRVRAAAALSGALVGGLGGREVGQGAVAAGRGIRGTARYTHQAMR